MDAVETPSNPVHISYFSGAGVGKESLWRPIWMNLTKLNSFFSRRRM
jgi:hypothetical protein